MQRTYDTEKARRWYKITDENKKSTINFPLKFIPFLNQTRDSIFFYYSIDEFESKFFVLYLTWRKAMESILQQLNKVFASVSFYTIKEYEIVHSSFRAAIKVSTRPYLHFKKKENTMSLTLSFFL